MKAPVNTKTRKPENAKTGGINLWTRKRRKRENGENAKTAKTRKPRKRGKRENAKTAKTRKRENGENGENPKTAKSVSVFWFSISRFLVFSVFSVFWFSRFLVFSFRWPHPSGQVAFFMCLGFSEFSQSLTLVFRVLQIIDFLSQGRCQKVEKLNCRNFRNVMMKKVHPCCKNSS